MQIGPPQPGRRQRALHGSTQPCECGLVEPRLTRTVFNREAHCGGTLPLRGRRQPLPGPGGKGPCGKPGYTHHWCISRSVWTQLEISLPIVQETLISEQGSDPAALPLWIRPHEIQELRIRHRSRIEPESRHLHALQLILPAK